MLLFLFFIFFSSTPCLLSVHIYSQPVTVTPENPYNCYNCLQIIIPVLFENPLFTNEYISITSPMSLNGVTATIQSMNFVESTLIVALASDPVYFLQPNFTIPFNVWMNITLYIQDASSFTNGIKGCIKWWPFPI